MELTVTSQILPPAPLDALHALWRYDRRWPELKLISGTPYDSPMRRLGRTELATLRVHADLTADREACRGIVFEAAVRLAVWADRGVLRYMSGWTVARELQNHFYPRSFAASKPVRGLDLLVAIDYTSDYHGVSVTLDADPTDDLHHRPMRLRDRFGELAR